MACVPPGEEGFVTLESGCEELGTLHLWLLPGQRHSSCLHPLTLPLLSVTEQV